TGKLRTGTNSRSLILHVFPEAVDVLPKPPQDHEGPILRPIRTRQRVERMFGIGVILPRQTENELPRPDHDLTGVGTLREAAHSRLRYAVTKTEMLMAFQVSVERVPFLHEQESLLRCFDT